MKVDYTKLLAPMVFKNHWDEEIKTPDYHEDRTAVNSSALKKIVKSPLAFHNIISGQKTTPTAAMQFGNLAHLAILQSEMFMKRVKVLPNFGDLRNKENKANRQDYLNSLPPDAIMVTEEEQEKLIGMAESILANNEAMNILKMGKPEICGYWKDEPTGIKCRMQADFVSFKNDVLLDLKTTTDCDWNEFRRSAESLQYHFQLMMYAAGIEAITGKIPDVIGWIVVEKEAPYECAIYEMSPHYQAAGSFDFRNAMDKLKECIDAQWFGPAQTESEIVEPSVWFMKQYESKGAFKNIMEG